MKKIMAVLFSVVCIMTLLTLPTMATEEKICLTFHSDVQGMTTEDVDKLVTIEDEWLSAEGIRLQISDYVGNVYFDPMKPGRTYYMDFSFCPVEGKDLPAVLDESNTKILCEPGCSVYWYGITHGAKDARFAAFHTKVTVQGNWWQMLTGRIIDLWKKMLAWAPY